MDVLDQGPADAPRRRSRRWLLPAAGIAVVLGAGLVGGLLVRGSGPTSVPAEPPGTDPQLAVRVVMCAPASVGPGCKGAATAAQKQAVVRTLRKNRLVTRIAYRSAERELADLRAVFSPAVVETIAGLGALPEAYDVRVSDESKAQSVAEAAADLSGVDLTVVTAKPRRIFPHGPAADVSVFFCVPSNIVDCRRRPSATAAQRAAVKARIQTLPSVKSFWYESQQQAIRSFALGLAVPGAEYRFLRPDDLPDSYRLSLRVPGWSAAVTRMLTGLPGVDQAVDTAGERDKVWAPEPA